MTVQTAGSKRCARRDIASDTVQAVANHATHETHSVAWQRCCLPGVVSGGALAKLCKREYKKPIHVLLPYSAFP